MNIRFLRIFIFLMRAFTAGIVNARTPYVIKKRNRMGTHIIAIFGVLLGFVWPVSSRAANNCTGATYYDATNDTCIACPAGYTYNTDDGKTSINQCQIKCPPGAIIDIYLPEKYERLKYVESTGTGQYVSTDFVVNRSNRDLLKIEVKSQQLSGSSGWRVDGVGGNNSIFTYVGIGPNGTLSYGSGGADVQTSVPVDIYDTNIFSIDYKKKLVVLNGVNYNVNVKTIPNKSQNLYIFTYASTGNKQKARKYYFKIYSDDVLVKNIIPVRRKNDNVVGMFDTVNNVFYTKSGTGNFIAGEFLSDDEAKEVWCVDVSPGYWSAGSITNYGNTGTRNACPVGTTTVGFGHGADEANDCGPALHIGEHVIYMRANRQTSPALHIKMPNGNTYYANMSSTDHNLSRLHLAYGGNQYTVYDESLLNAEREF